MSFFRNNGIRKRWLVSSVASATLFFTTMGFALIGVPIPGHHCGPDKIKPLAWAIADKWQFFDKTVSFENACKQHDLCYSDCLEGAQHRVDKETCDQQFFLSMEAVCEEQLNDTFGKKSGSRRECKLIAQTYLEGVKRNGNEFYSKSCRG